MYSNDAQLDILYYTHQEGLIYKDFSIMLLLYKLLILCSALTAFYSIYLHIFLAIYFFICFVLCIFYLQ
jgi:hypothetical protein